MGSRSSYVQSTWKRYLTCCKNYSTAALVEPRQRRDRKLERTFRRGSRYGEPTTLAGDDKVDRFRALAFFIRLDVERKTLSFVQRLETCTFDRGDVHEHIAPTILGLDESVTALGIEELDGTCICHRETPFPVVVPAGPHGATARPDIRNRGKHQPLKA